MGDGENRRRERIFRPRNGTSSNSRKTARDEGPARQHYGAAGMAFTAAWTAAVISAVAMP